MSLRDVFSDATAAIYEALDDIPIDAHYKALASATYDASAGRPIAARSSASIQVISEIFTRREIDGENIKPDDRKFIVACATLGSIVPAPEDTIIVGVEPWNIVNVDQDPAGAIYFFHVRRP